MTHQAVEKFTSSVIEIWQDTTTIRELFAPNLTQKEFKFFMGLGMTMQANPFKREIWAVKYDDKKAATIFLGRDFYRKKAQEQADYNGHQPMAVFEKDTFEYDLHNPTGLPTHKFDVTKDRGKVVGFYCFAYKKGIERPFFVYVSIEEAMIREQSTWKTQKVTMGEKVVEARCLRMTWQGVFAGTYSGAEQPLIEQSEKKRALVTELKEKQKESKEVVTGEIVSEDFNNLNDATVKLKTRLEKCIVDKGGNPDQGMIIDALMKFTENKDGSIIDYEKMSPARAKYTLLRFEVARFKIQLNETMPEGQVTNYLKEITAFKDHEGIDSVDKFKSVDHLYMAKGHFKKDQEAGFFSKQKDLL